MLSRPYAFGCVMRLRTSSQFKIADSVNTPKWCVNYLHQLSHIYPWLICLYFFISTVWSFLPRSSIHACSTHKLLWLFCYIQLWLRVWKGFSIFQVTSILFLRLICFISNYNSMEFHSMLPGIGNYIVLLLWLLAVTHVPKLFLLSRLLYQIFPN